MEKYIKKKTRNILDNNFVFAAYNKTYNFGRKTHLRDFANRMNDKELSLDNAKEEQKYFFKKIDELKNRINLMI